MEIPQIDFRTLEGARDFTLNQVSTFPAPEVEVIRDGIVAALQPVMARANNAYTLQNPGLRADLESPPKLMRIILEGAGIESFWPQDEGWSIFAAITSSSELSPMMMYEYQPRGDHLQRLFMVSPHSGQLYVGGAAMSLRSADIAGVPGAMAACIEDTRSVQ